MWILQFSERVKELKGRPGRVRSCIHRVRNNGFLLHVNQLHVLTYLLAVVTILFEENNSDSKSVAEERSCEKEVVAGIIMAEVVE